MNRKGSVSMLLLLILPVLLLGAMVMTEAARWRVGQMWLQQALESTARSVLGAYDRQVFSDYGLMVVSDVREDDIEQLLMANLDGSDLLDLRVESIWWEPVQSIEEEQVMLQQILETVKYAGPVNLTRSLSRVFKGFQSARDLSDAGQKAVLLDQANRNMGEIENNNRKIRETQEDIRSINRQIREERNRPESDDARIERLQRRAARRRETMNDLYDRNRDLVLEVDRLLGRAGEPSLPAEDRLEGIDPLDWIRERMVHTVEARQRLEEKTGLTGLEEGLPRERPDTLPADAGREAFRLMDQLRRVILEGRNEMYLGEYVLMHLSNLNNPREGRPLKRTEAEYVITGASSHPQIVFLLQLAGVRTALNTVGYFAFSPPPAPVGPVSRVVFSLLMGAWEGVMDVFRLVGAENRVPVVNMTPSVRNPLRNVQVDYEDHLRVGLLLVDRNDKLHRIRSLVPVSGTTGIRVEAEVSMAVLFEPGPWMPEGVVRDGRVYFRKELAMCY